jgi:3-hydroxyisobutyrate dehydrogenase-like beta-hydroxyacid dehydrogenase
MLEITGSRIRVVEDGAAGDAITLKILRSVFTKGLEALSVEMLMSAAPAEIALLAVGSAATRSVFWRY